MTWARTITHSSEKRPSIAPTVHHRKFCGKMDPLKTKKMVLGFGVSSGSNGSEKQVRGTTFTPPTKQIKQGTRAEHVADQELDLSPLTTHSAQCPTHLEWGMERFLYSHCVLQILFENMSYLRGGTFRPSFYLKTSWVWKLKSINILKIKSLAIRNKWWGHTADHQREAWVVFFAGAAGELEGGVWPKWNAHNLNLTYFIETLVGW